MPIAQTSNFLVPNGTFIFELIAFLIVLGVIGWKVLPPLNRMLAQRQDQIRGELEAADQAKTDAEQADTERRRELEAARQKARETVAQANHTADQVLAARQAQAQAEYERIVHSADAEVALARQAAVEQITARVGEIIIAAAERVIGREIQAADHQELINEAIAAVSAEAAGTGAATGSGG